MKLKEKCEKLIENGVIFENNSGCQFKVVDYVKGVGVIVQFLGTGYKTTAQLGNVLRGSVRDRLKPSVCGVGVVGIEVTRIDGKQTKEYELWNSMLTRCYNIKIKQNIPTYKHCEVSENFKYFTNFKEWCNNQVGFNYKDDKGNSFQLDKDILVKGNKIYSEDTCCFVPCEINNLFTKSNSVRGTYTIGVSRHEQTGKFHARVNISGEMTHLGLFETEIEAFTVYKQVKEAYIKHLAEKWKASLDVRVYNSLIEYNVEITD